VSSANDNDGWEVKMTDEEYIIQKLFHESDGIMQMKQEIDEKENEILRLKKAMEKAMECIAHSGVKRMWEAHDILEEALDYE
jgi:hypothetical protein